MSTPPSSYFPLRWESTGDQWWYASPIDWAAANGHYDLVRELLHIDPNLLIKLTSLRRIRRLETVWDDDPRFLEVARCRATVARRLLLECEGKEGVGNGLLRAGYGGWLLYTAASAGDEGFVEELLGRDPLMVFGEGEFGVTDVLYAAARSRNAKVFGVLLEHAMTPTTCSTKVPNEQFRWEMRNRALHAAARGGSLEIVKELVRGGCHVDLRAFRDAHGSTVLHAASGRGQVEVVKGLIKDFDIIGTTDNHGNTSLHIAAFGGHLGVVEILISACPTSISLTNHSGNTFLHLAIHGFRTPGFRRLDRQMELMKQLVSSRIISIESIVNIRNNEGRTILHLAVVGNVHYNLVALLIKVPSIDLNIHDIDGMTPLDLLSRRPRTATYDLLIRQMVSAGGVLNSRNFRAQSSIASYPRMHVSSPGTCFKISDAEIFLYAGMEASGPNGLADRDSRRASSCSSDCQSGPTPSDASDGNHNSAADSKRRSSAASRLKSLFHWPRQKKKQQNREAGTPGKSGENSLNSRKKWNEKEGTPTPLRQRFSNPTSLRNNKRAFAIPSFSPSPPSKKFADGLRHGGTMETMPHLAHEMKVPITPSSRLSMASSPSSDRQKGICSEIENEGPSSNSSMIEESMENTSLRPSFVSSKLMNQYLCFGPHGLAVEDPNADRRSKRRPILSVA